MMRAAGDDADAVRLRGLIVVLWRAGLRVSEALALSESDLDAGRGAVLVRRLFSDLEGQVRRTSGRRARPRSDVASARGARAAPQR